MIHPLALAVALASCLLLTGCSWSAAGQVGTGQETSVDQGSCDDVGAAHERGRQKAETRDRPKTAQELTAGRLNMLMMIGAGTFLVGLLLMAARLGAPFLATYWPPLIKLASLPTYVPVAVMAGGLFLIGWATLPQSARTWLIVGACGVGCYILWTSFAHNEKSRQKIVELENGSND